MTVLGAASVPLEDVDCHTLYLADHLALDGATYDEPATLSVRADYNVSLSLRLRRSSSLGLTCGSDGELHPSGVTSEAVYCAGTLAALRAALEGGSIAIGVCPACADTPAALRVW